MNTKENVNDLYIYPANFQKTVLVVFLPLARHWQTTAYGILLPMPFPLRGGAENRARLWTPPGLRRDITFQPAPPAVFLNGNPVAHLIAKKLHFRLFYIFFSTKVTPRSTFSLH